MKTALVIGLGLSGRAALALLEKKGYSVSTYDDGSAKEGQFNAVCSQIADRAFDLIVASPGVPPEHEFLQLAKKRKVECIGEIELALRHFEGRVIGVTGTNGKTTVVMLICHLLNAAGIPALTAGNIGLPLSQLVHDETIKSSVVVLELSSAQLETMSHKALGLGLVLNISPDHLDRYDSMGDYAATKLSISNCLKPSGDLFVHESIQKNYPIPKDAKIYGYNPSNFISCDHNCIKVKEKLVSLLPLRYRGINSHDVDNILAAYAACRQFGLGGETALEPIETFRKPEHRLEFVAKVAGVEYINDSKGTNIDSVICAVQSIQRPIVLIAGGVDKGGAYEPWLESFLDKVKQVYVIGQAAKKIEKTLSSSISVKHCEDLDHAFQNAADTASSGDTVLLSPGCSSFDMFNNYACRGNAFKRLVQHLEYNNKVK
jgi:UDP-N-acetylmuramoylalanine--D-glutamate ligase